VVGGPGKPSGSLEERGGTKARILAAAIETLKQEGFAGSSARAIARTGGFNQALIFYHFGGVNELLLAALDATSAGRMERYRTTLDEAEGPDEVLRLAERIYLEDLEHGDIKVLAELIAGASAVPGLGPKVAARIEPWIAFAEEGIRRTLAGSAFAQLLPVRDLAFAVVAFYLGVELLAHLDGERGRAESLVTAARRLAALAQPFLGGPPPTVPSGGP
jgi:AcrR family transcriptional regulator